MGWFVMEIESPYELLCRLSRKIYIFLVTQTEKTLPKVYQNKIIKSIIHKSDYMIGLSLHDWKKLPCSTED
jgi:hypothetical protein